MADEKEQAPPKVGPELFTDPGDETKAEAPPKVGPDIFAPPISVDKDAGQAVKKPVGAEVFSEKQLEGIVGEPILSPGEEGAAAQSEVAATAAAQAHADELGVDITQVKGTGKDGQITKADVADHAAGTNQ